VRGLKIIILGGTGTISREIVRQALDAGHELTLINRGSRKTGVESRVKTVVADRHSREFAGAVEWLTADVVIDMICFQADDARQTVELFGNRCGQIIVTSSVAAYERPTRSIPIREDAELLRTDDSFIYGYWKAEIERYLAAAAPRISAAVTVIRPSFTFGEGTANLGIFRQNRNLVRRMREGKPVVMLGEGVNPWSFTFARDLASAYVLAAGNPRTFGKTYHVTNTELVTWQDLYYSIGRAVGAEPKLCYVPSVLLRDMYPDVCSHLYYEKAFFNYYSNEKFMADVPEYRPVVTLDEGIREVVDWWERSGFPYDEEKDALEDRVCAAYCRFSSELADIGRSIL
jgi:nucleoside-diphosphate-sugar epimerase